jgi:sugar/nucleoside kinase (ribokinase family)
MIEDAFAKARGRRVLFVGENIEDEYIYVEPLYKPSKETIIAVHEVSRETFTGGILAAAEHIRGWCQTRVVTQWRPVRKTRFVQAGFNHKLFEVYADHAVQSLLNGDELNEAVKASDIVIVMDFGHGLIDDSIREILYGAKFLAVSAQTNAGNHGFNPVTKYRHADYICVDYQEARLAVGDQWGALETVIERLCERMGTGRLIVTEGRRGASWRGGRCPALESHPVDTIGAGDCFMAYTAPLVATGLALADVALVGCIAAGMKTEIVGHRKSVNPETVLEAVRRHSDMANRRAVTQGRV